MSFEGIEFYLIFDLFILLLIGILLAALAVQLMLDGLHELGIITMMVGH